MYIDADTIIRAAALLGALTAIGLAAYKIVRWVQMQEKQTIDIEKLREKEQQDIQEMKDEQALISYALLACLDGLKQQGCNGTVTEAYNRMQKHLNQRAHTQHE